MSAGVNTQGEDRTATRALRIAGYTATLWMLGIAAPSIVSAQTIGATSTLAVSFTKGAACQITAGNLNMGTAQIIAGPGGAGIAASGQTTVSVTCPNAVPYKIAFDYGLNEVGTNIGTRQMAGPSSGRISYTLFQGSTSGPEVGNGEFSGYGFNAISATGTGGAQTHTIVGAIQATSSNSTQPAGAYTDTVQITIYL